MTLRAMAAAFLALMVELLVVGVLHRSEVASVWELQFGLLWLLPLMLLGAVFAGALGALLSSALRQSADVRVRAVLAVAAALAAGAAAWGVGGGRHLATLSTRGGFAALVALVAAAGTYALAPALQRLHRGRPEAVALGFVGVAIALEIANQLLLVRLYPAFHLTLAALAALSAACAGALSPGAPRDRARWMALAGVVGLVALVAARPAALRLARFDNFRLWMLEHAPLGAELVRTAALLAPPPPISAESCVDASCGEMLAARSNRSPLDWRGRDLLLISIDALRADHVGAYGYSRPTTPNIDRLAKSGVVFEHAYCATPHTSYSVTSMMTGKYMRPLLLQGAGEDSDTWASLLRTYGYRTGGFYPPAVFFIDPRRFTHFRDTHLGFEYVKTEFLEGDARAQQVEGYLLGLRPDQHVFAWVHLFAPHEPYEAHPGHDFGDRDVDRYDSEIAFADHTVGKLVAAFRKRSPKGVVIVTADHGEEFGEHGGRYHGSSVYEEQVRVPLVIDAPEVLPPRRISETVQSVDLLPTVLGALDIPRPARMRGRDLGALLAKKREPEAGLALAETEEQALLAEGPWRLVCQRKVGACRLYDVSTDPKEQRDVAPENGERFSQMRERLRQMSASHGRYEVRGLRAEGRGWPAAILRGVTGDGDAAPDIAPLLDDADVAIRRKAAELLFQLARPETAPALRLALSRDEDETVKRWAALALTRMDQGAPLAFELVKSDDLRWRRLAALALAESGDKRGEGILIAWWKDDKARDYDRSRELLDAFATIRSKDAVWPLVQSLGDVRLRPYIAACLSKIGDDVARVPLAKALGKERYQGARVAIADALVHLGAEAEMAKPLVRFLGVPDPLPNGLEVAMKAKILPNVGGPDEHDRKRLESHAGLGVGVTVVVPKGGNGSGIRVLVLARARGETGTAYVAPPLNNIRYNRKGEPIKVRDLPRLDRERTLRIPVPISDTWREVYALAPKSLGAKPGGGVRLVVFADRHVEIAAIALVPLADELPPPAPKPWHPDGGAPDGGSDEEP
ncbi:MAG: sulfatase-like hydrolase/transferase [Myxococcales bacterium]|nr:sulfatase-like hydrolase/transferase [Myxococcales bacterium]MCB9581018.1 sulfatase-like hydrolase/transferase [Polyangiaceae bacterium]